MKKKGLIYRVTMLFGLSIMGFHMGGELFYSKYYKAERDKMMQEKMNDEERIE